MILKSSAAKYDVMIEALLDRVEQQGWGYILSDYATWYSDLRLK